METEYEQKIFEIINEVSENQMTDSSSKSRVLFSAKEDPLNDWDTIAEKCNSQFHTVIDAEYVEKVFYKSFYNQQKQKWQTEFFFSRAKRLAAKTLSLFDSNDTFEDFEVYYNTSKNGNKSGIIMRLSLYYFYSMVPVLHNPDSLDSLLKLDSTSAEKCFDRIISIRKKELYPKTISDYESEIEQLPED